MDKIVLPTISLQNKNYVLVKDRLKYFREKFTDYSLRSDVTLGANGVHIKGVIRNPQGRIVAEGNAMGSFKAEKGLEKVETTAWGRALANFGIGIDDSVSSADEMAQFISSSQPSNA